MSVHKHNAHCCPDLHLIQSGAYLTCRCGWDTPLDYDSVRARKLWQRHVAESPYCCTPTSPPSPAAYKRHQTSRTLPCQVSLADAFSVARSPQPSQARGHRVNRCLDPQCLDGPTDDEPRPRFADNGLLCARCAGHLERRLTELKARHDEVARVMLTPLPSRSTGGNKPTKGSPPVELNLTAHDWIVEAVATLVSWTRMVCEDRDLRGPDRSDVGALSTWMLSHLDWLREHGAVGDLADEMRDLSRKAEGIAKPHPSRYRLEAPCPLCAAFELTREDGDDHVWCGACSNIWREDQYPWMVRVALAGHGGFVTAAEAVTLARVKPEVFRQWVSRKRVKRLGTVDGQARYSLADLNNVIAHADEEGVA